MKSAPSTPTARRRPLVCAALAALLLAACAETQPATYYTLAPIAPDDSAGAATAPASAPFDLAVGLGPVTLPQYLDRPQIVSRSERHRLTLAEFDRWAEPIHDTVVRTLTENLSGLLGTERIVPLPNRRAWDLDYLVEVDVLRFDTDAEGNSHLAARWAIFRADGTAPLLVRRTDVVRPVADHPDGAQHYAAVAAAMSACLGDLSRALAEALQRPSRATP